LVRHGESTFNISGKVQGRGNSDRPELQSLLSEQGQKQARLAGTALANLSFHAAYSSPLLRAQQTAQTILAAISSAPTLRSHEELYEINLPQWEGMNFEQVKIQFPNEHRAWQDAPDQFLLGDRYPVLELFAQAKAFWQEILARHQGETILVVGHSGINRSLISTALGIKPAHYHRLQQSNCGISVLNFGGTEFGDSSVQLESLNLTSHLSTLTGSPLPSVRNHHAGPRLLLVRHGETEWNREKRFQGQIDVPLNPRGEEQAKTAAEFLGTTPIQLGFSSPMLRPKQTAIAILEAHAQVPLELLDDLKEISHGLWEGKLETEIEAEFPGELQHWQKTPEAVQMPEGENLDQVWQRVSTAWQQIIRTTPSNQTALVVAHDAVNKAILCLLFDLSPASFWAFKQGNGGVCVIDYHRGYDQPPTLQAMNITTHLSNSILDTTAAGAL
jgi:phosphoserine phosphatase